MIHSSATPADHRETNTREDEHRCQGSVSDAESVVNLMPRHFAPVGVIIAVMLRIARDDLGVRLSVDEEKRDYERDEDEWCRDEAREERLGGCSGS